MSLRAFTFLSDRQVRGKATGDITLDGFHDDAHANADITFDGLMVGDVASRAAHMQATLDGHSFDASARFDQEDNGYLDARAHAGEHWGRALVPALDSSQPANVVVSAKNFRAQWLLPFVWDLHAARREDRRRGAPRRRPGHERGQAPGHDRVLGGHLRARVARR